MIKREGRKECVYSLNSKYIQPDQMKEEGWVFKIQENRENTHNFNQWIREMVYSEKNETRTNLKDKK